jgi:hypothetical protein
MLRNLSGHVTSGSNSTISNIAADSVCINAALVVKDAVASNLAFRNLWQNGQ